MHVVSLHREVRLHLSIAFESQLSSLCIRFALTLHLLSEAASKAPQMKKQYSLFIHSAFFDIVLPQKVRQVGLSETRGSVVEFYHTAFATEPANLEIHKSSDDFIQKKETIFEVNVLLGEKLLANLLVLNRKQVFRAFFKIWV